MRRDDSKSAFITGATSGIGEAFARRLASEGYDLTITGRRKERIRALADELSKRHQVAVETIIIELSDPGEVAKLVEKVRSRTIDILINNAGFGTHDVFCREDPKSQEEMVFVHVLCPMRLIHAVLPNMIARGSGAIVNVSSEAAFVPLPRGATYSGTKAFLRAFSESLHVELMGTGVKVQALCPGFTKTDFHDRMGVEETEEVNSRLVKWLTSAEVVNASLKCLKKSKVVCVPGFLNRLQLLLLTMVPAPLYYRAVHRLFCRNKQGIADSGDRSPRA